MLAELTLIVGLSTSHTAYNEFYNNDNQLFMVQYDNYTAGTMINSYGHRSFMAGYDFNATFDKLTLGALWGAVTGYNKPMEGNLEDGTWYRFDAPYGSPVMPMIAPYLRSAFDSPVNLQAAFLGNPLSGGAVNFSAAITF